MSRYINPVPFIQDDDGKPIVGAKLFFFEPGTTTPKTIYSDPGLETPTDNPQISKAGGRYTDDIFLDGVYAVEQQDNSGTPTGYDGVLIWEKDPVGDITTGQLEPWVNDETYNVGDIVLGSDVEYYRSIINGNQGNDPTTSPEEWEQIQYGRVWNEFITYDITDSVYGSDGYLYKSTIASNLNNDPISDAVNWTAIIADSGIEPRMIGPNVGTNFLAGLTLSNNAIDLLQDLDISSGTARDSTDTKSLVLPTGLTKQLDASWMAGTDQGGLSSSLTPTADTWYHVFIVEIAGDIDVLFDTSPVCANGIVDHTVTEYRRIGAFLTDGGANILVFTDVNKRFTFDATIQDFSGSYSSTRAALVVSTPLGVATKVIGYHAMASSAGINSYLRIAPLADTDVVPGLTNCTAATGDDTAGYYNGSMIEVMTNTLSQIGTRSSATLGGTFNTFGWEDTAIREGL